LQSELMAHAPLPVALDVRVTSRRSYIMTATNKKAPGWIAYAVRDYKTADGKEDAVWRQIGAVWDHSDGKGFDIILDALPVNGRIVVREPKPRDEAAPTA